MAAVMKAGFDAVNTTLSMFNSKIHHNLDNIRNMRLSNRILLADALLQASIQVRQGDAPSEPRSIPSLSASSLLSNAPTPSWKPGFETHLFHTTANKFRLMHSLPRRQMDHGYCPNFHNGKQITRTASFPTLWGKCRGEFDQITRANGRHQSEEKPRNRPETSKNAGKNGSNKIEQMARIQAETAWNLGTNVTKALQKR
ncbi:hypothetical protein BD560DRAFT_424169 [Blakeslea trispora]|nr:hypothetical protein BD560DRAFT_424169 [Blakeslea trispora]